MYYGRRFDYLFMAVLPISRRTGSCWIWSSLCVYPVESPSINIRFNSLVRLSTESLLRSSDRWNWLCRLDPQPVGTHQADSPHAPFVQFCEHLTPDQGAPHVFVGAPPDISRHLSSQIQLYGKGFGLHTPLAVDLHVFAIFEGEHVIHLQRLSESLRDVLAEVVMKRWDACLAQVLAIEILDTSPNCSCVRPFV